MLPKPNTDLIDPRVDFHDDVGKQGLIIQHSQEIPDSFLDSLKRAKNASTAMPAGEFHRVASIPVVIYEKWRREGYDPAREPIAKTLAKLSNESLDHFITTGKKF